MRRHLIAETDCVDIVGVARNAKNTALRFEVIDVDAVIACACHYLAAIAGEPKGPNTEMSTSPTPSASSTESGPTTTHVREVKHARLRGVALISVRKTYLASDTTIS